MTVYLLVVTLFTCFELEGHLAVKVSSKSSKCSTSGTCQSDSKPCTGSYISNCCSDQGPTIRYCTKTPIVDDISKCPNLKIISRDSWGARRPTGEIKTIDEKLQRLFIHHGSSPPCLNRKDCMETIRGYQTDHQYKKKKPFYDIGYSFLVGEDGYVYEGRGWAKEGAHTEGYNFDSIGLCFIGDFMSARPNDAALKSAKRFIECAKDLGYLSANYSLYGHRDVKCTLCPGDMLYKEIATWDNFHSFTGETVKKYCK